MTQPLRGKPLQKAIIEQARRLGWRVAHTPPILAKNGGWRNAIAADGKGFPDLLLLRDRCIVAEVKGDGDSLKPEQREWLTAFRIAAVESYVWTPRDWRTGMIDEILTRRGPPEPQEIPVQESLASDMLRR